MTIDHNEIKRILDTLPIAFYLKRPVKVTYEPDGNASYMDTRTLDITIGGRNIAGALKGMAEGEDPEPVIRGLLYHEVSHCMLTPKDFYNRVDHDIYNIFEDERIETLLAGYYMHVDFKANVFKLNGVDPNNMPALSTDPIGRFYNAVRFRNDPVWTPEVLKLIAKYAKLSRAFPDWEGEYERDIDRLFKKMNIAKPTEPPKQAPKQTDEQTGDGEPDDTQPGGPSMTAAINEAMRADDKQANPYGSNVMAGQLENQITKALQAGKITDADIEAIARKVFTNGQSIADSMEHISNELRDIDPAIESAVDRILTLALNRRRNRSNTSHGYSGTLDPRMLANHDHRWKVFERAGNEAGKKFNKIQLNLWLDNSGSFNKNAPIVNKLLATLARLEETHSDFEFVVVRQDCHTTLCDKSERYITADGGSYFEYDEARPVWTKINSRTDREIYNILLFDGSMSSSTVEQAFALVDVPNMTMIVEEQNVAYLPQSPKSHIIIENSNYTGRLLENVLKALSRAFIK